MRETIKLQNYLVRTLVDAMKDVSDEKNEETFESTKLKGKLPFNLSLDGSIKLSNAADIIVKEREEAFENYTFEDIRNMLKNILIEVHHSKPQNPSNFITSRVKKLVSEIKNEPDKYFYLIPTMNIDLLIDHLSIGDVCFLRLTDKKIEELKRDFSDDELFYLGLNEKKGTVVARISNVTASTVNKASEKALSALEDALNALRVVHPWSYIGIQGDWSYGPRELMYKNESVWTVGKTLEIRNTGLVANPMEIDEGTLDWMEREGGLEDIQKLFSIESPNPFQKSILTSIHWFGEAVKDEKEEDRFVKLIIALESIFIKNRGESKAEKVSERYALFVGRNKEERIDLYNKMKEYIKIRNKIVHDGFTGGDHYDLRFLTQYARESIIELYKRCNDYEKLEKFLEELDERKFE